MRKNILIIVAVFCSLSVFSQKTSLDGEWRFILDPFNVGEKIGFQLTNVDLNKWEKVTVPHCFNDDEKFMFYTGNTWYTRKFKVGEINLNRKLYVKFEAVYYKSTVYVNGKLAGMHEGGYTPFEFDITSLVNVNSSNVITVKVDNLWDENTIPGAKPLPKPGEQLTYSLFFPWINYGGIIRSVALIERPQNYIKNVKIEADPDLVKGFATIKVKSFVVNPSGNSKVLPVVDISYQGAPLKLKWKVLENKQISDELTLIISSATIPAKQVNLWGINYPNLYNAQVVLAVDTFSTNFGIRKIEIKGTKFLLNGEPLFLGGANRVTEYPGEGSKDPMHVLEKDLQLMKEANMLLSRIAHYPVSTQLLEWADKNGMLIITEAGNWQMTESQMASPTIRKNYQQQAREMIERDWNHPSVIAYSVGNEYNTLSPIGIAWTKDMIDFTREIDATRKLTVCSNRVARAKSPEEEASQHVDFVSVNCYGGHERVITKIHELYPDKPIYISEFGYRADEVKNEEDRAEKLKQNLEVIRKYDYVMGASIWTFNHYRSRYNGTAADGYRPWGVVTADRTKLKSYDAIRMEFAPAYFENVQVVADQLKLKLVSRKDFPRMILEGHKLRLGNAEFPVSKMFPGQSQEFTLPLNTTSKKIELISPTGFVVLESDIPLNQ
jgi:beta-glucuronidase